MDSARPRPFVAFRRLLLNLILLATAFHGSQTCWAAKNIILMIADGSGQNAWLAASMFQGKVGGQIYDQPGWLRFSCTTYPLNLWHKPTNNLQQNSALLYDPAKAWDIAPRSTTASDCAGYIYLASTCTDSAAAATALATGQKTYNNAINWTNDNRPMQGKTIAEIAKQQGKSVGVITSVPWSHATPAGLGGAHNVSRNQYAEIANEMLAAHWLDVIMGAGNPDFDCDGRPIPDENKKNYKYVGGKNSWQTLKQGKTDWKLIETKADFEALATGPAPSKVLGTAQVSETLQAKRHADRVDLPYDKVTADPSITRLSRLPYTIPLNDNVPTLATMSKAAIHCLDDNPNGFYLMIEGGAVDWANHANEPDHMIEEQIDFVNAVEAVVAWIESHGGWNDTLLILTADHETGLLWGPDSAKIPFQPIVDHGPGKLPGMRFNSHGHSNSLVSLYARGPGSQRFETLVKGKDATAAEKWHNAGPYVDNTDVFQVMQAEATEKR
jgi:alkaline phosphatase